MFNVGQRVVMVRGNPLVLLEGTVVGVQGVEFEVEVPGQPGFPARFGPWGDGSYRWYHPTLGQLILEPYDPARHDPCRPASPGLGGRGGGV